MRVAKPVTETSTREERYTTYRPVTETFEETRVLQSNSHGHRDRECEEKHLVARQVIEEQCRTEQHVVRRPVEETVMQQQNYVVNEPVTVMQTSYVDQGSYVDNVFQTPGSTRYRLAWVPGGFQTEPVTAWRHAGFGRVPVTTPGQTVVNRQYVPNIVPVQVPQTSMVQKVVTQCVPVTVQKYVDEVVTQQVPVQVQRTEYVEETKPVTVQVQKPVTEQVAYKVQNVRTRYEAVEVVKPITCTVQRMTYEDVEQPYEVRTMKMVSEVQTVRKPVVVRKLVPYSYIRSTPHTVAMMVPVDDVPAIRQMYRQSSDCGSCVAGPIVESRRVEVAPQHRDRIEADRIGPDRV